MSRQLDYYYRKGKAQRKARKANLEGKALSANHIVSVQSNQSSKPNQQLRQFCHRLYRVYDKLQASKPRGEGVPNMKPKQVRFEGGLETRYHLILEGVQEWGTLAEPSLNVQRKAEAKADALALTIARDRSIAIKPGGITKLVEIAITNTEGARHLAEQNKGKLILYENRRGDLLWVDRTPNPAAFEGNRAEIVQRWKEGIVRPIEKGAWTAPKQLKHNRNFRNKDMQLEANLAYLAQQVIEQGKNLSELIKILKVKL